MPEAYDIAIAADNEPEIRKGDFRIVRSEEQHIEDILVAAPGHWRQFPIQGVDLPRRLKMRRTQAEVNELRKAIRIQLEYDNWRVNSLDLGDLSKTVIDAERLI